MDAEAERAEAVEAADVDTRGGRAEAVEESWLVFVIIGGGGPRVDMLGRASTLSAARARKLIPAMAEMGEESATCWLVIQHIDRRTESTARHSHSEHGARYRSAPNDRLKVNETHLGNRLTAFQLRRAGM